MVYQMFSFPTTTSKKGGHNVWWQTSPPPIIIIIIIIITTIITIIKKQKAYASPSNFSCQKSHVLKCSLSKFQNYLDLEIAECNGLHWHWDLLKESFEKQMKGALESNWDLEKHLHGFYSLCPLYFIKCLFFH